MSKQYEITGIPLNLPAEFTHGLRVGDEIELELDKDREQALVGAGAVRPVRASAKKADRTEALAKTPEGQKDEP